MKKALMAGSVLVLAITPASAMAKPNKTDRANAAQECRSERGGDAGTRAAFALRYGTNRNKRNAFGKCVSKRSRSEERQRVGALTNAAKECQAERALNPTAFALKYGTNPNVKYGNPNGGNAFGKCVSGKAMAKKQASDVADARTIARRKNAARACAGERTGSRPSTSTTLSAGISTSGRPSSSPW